MRGTSAVETMWLSVVVRPAERNCRVPPGPPKVLPYTKSISSGAVNSPSRRACLRCDLCSMKWFQATALEPLWPMPSLTASATTGTSASRLAHRVSFRLSEASRAGNFTGCVRKCVPLSPPSAIAKRVHAETVFSAIKRKLSAKAPGRSLTTQRKQALLLGLAYNIYKLWPPQFRSLLHA